MRKYPGMHLPPGGDPVLRGELTKVDRQLKQLSSALARVLTKSNLPTAVVSIGGGGVPGQGNLPDHDHTASGKGGNYLGDCRIDTNSHRLYGPIECVGTNFYHDSSDTTSWVIYDADAGYSNYARFIFSDMANSPFAGSPGSNTYAFPGQGYPLSSSATLPVVDQSASLAQTTIYNGMTSGTRLYLCTVYALCTSAGSAGTLAVTWHWEDPAAARTSTVISALDLTGTNWESASLIVASKVNTSIDISATITGGAGSPVYALYPGVTNIGLA